MEFLTRLENSAFMVWMAQSVWAYPAVLTFHAIGMALVVGIVVVISMRILGYPAAMPIAVLDRLVPVAWAGFALNFVSGTLLFAMAATKFVTNWAFGVKIALIIAGGIALWALLKSVMSEQEHARASTSKNKLIAALALAFWLSAVVAGRLIAYTG